MTHHGPSAHHPADGSIFLGVGPYGGAMWPGGLLLTVTSDSPPSVPAIRKQRKACTYPATWSRAERVMVPQRSRPCASFCTNIPPFVEPS